MKKKYLLAALIVLNILIINKTNEMKSFCEALSGSIDAEKYIIQGNGDTVVDISTGKPIPNAKIIISSKNINTLTDKNGNFHIDTYLNGPSILSINAKGYKPFSITINQDGLDKPITLGLTKSGNELVIDSTLHHLGDDNFSPDSANSDDFRLNAEGPVLAKDFYVGNISKNSNFSIKIGSIIGLDTIMAVKLGQSHSKSTSTPTRIFLNNHKIGEVRINGDNQEIPVPCELLNFNANNKLEIVTGKNIQPRLTVDYDDMEFINLILEVR